MNIYISIIIKYIQNNYKYEIIFVNLIKKKNKQKNKYLNKFVININ